MTWWMTLQTFLASTIWLHRTGLLTLQCNYSAPILTPFANLLNPSLSPTKLISMTTKDSKSTWATNQMAHQSSHCYSTRKTWKKRGSRCGLTTTISLSTQNAKLILSQLRTFQQFRLLSMRALTTLLLTKLMHIGSEILSNQMCLSTTKTSRLATWHSWSVRICRTGLKALWDSLRNTILCHLQRLNSFSDIF